MPRKVVGRQPRVCVGPDLARFALRKLLYHHASSGSKKSPVGLAGCWLTQVGTGVSLLPARCLGRLFAV